MALCNCFYQNPRIEHFYMKMKHMPKLHHEGLHFSNSTIFIKTYMKKCSSSLGGGAERSYK